MMKAKKSYESSNEDEGHKEYYDGESGYGTRESLNISPKYYANACQEMTLTDLDYDMPEINKIKFDKNTFKKLEKLGEGHFSDVYKGIDLRNNQKVAIKIMKKLKAL